ncbi:MAG TPA: potassium/proton antiporter [Coriobacteriia bacterium]|nr:potassium/proton antiporter [Coriobacteriia bacterium]
MTAALIIGAAILLLCIAFGQFIHRFGIPSLLIFLVLGIIAGALPIDQELISASNAENVGMAALIFVMFYGGFGTSWKTARPVAVKGVLLSTLGVCITAAAVTVFAFFAFGFPLAESFLLGAVISCTDAAALFSLLRTKKLNLKHNSVSALELESGSNDPTAYLLTLIAILLMQGGPVSDVPLLLVQQLGVGIVVGVGIPLLAIPFLKRSAKHFPAGMDLVFVFAIAVLSYALSTQLGGNGYLAAFLCGIIMGNSNIPNRVNLVHFFDSVDWFAQIIVFFLLGLLSNAVSLWNVLLPSVLLFVFILLIARPLAVFSIYLPHRNPVRQGLLISWVGMRGASSLVFALMAVSAVTVQNDLFSIVLLTALFSIAVQGTFVEQVARRLDMFDTETDVMRSFTDFQERSEQAFLKMKMTPGHIWVGRALKDLAIGQESLIVLIKRGDSTVAPNGNTVIEADDILVMTGEAYTEDEDAQLSERIIDRRDPWANKLIKDLELPENSLIVNVVKEDGASVTPHGWTKIHPGDTVTLIAWDAEGVEREKF